MHFHEFVLEKYDYKAKHSLPEDSVAIVSLTGSIQQKAQKCLTVFEQQNHLILETRLVTPR